MQIVGITGGIGSGKSTIAQELVKRGFTVYDCDREAKRIIAENKDVQQAIIALLGPEAFNISQGQRQYNTTYVAQRVFAEPCLRQQLNNIVHPAVKADICQRKPDFIESAILYEAGLDKLCDHVVVIDAPEDIRLARAIERDFHGEATEENINKVRARMRAQQMPTGPVLVICNDGSSPVTDLAEQLIQHIQHT